MKNKQNCEVENCIPTPTSCDEWNGGDIEYLGICNGDSLNNIVWELVYKLQAITGDDLSKFDIDSLLNICQSKAPLETSLISILTLLKENQICLKDYIDTLNDKIAELLKTSNVSVDLKCLADYDNIGNALQITREQLDQLVINNLCSHKERITALESKVITLKSQIDEISTSSTVDELNISTCINPAVLPTSTQVKNTSSELCLLESATGTPASILTALGKTANDVNAEFGLITGWILTPTTWAQNYGNLLLEVENLRQRIKFIENNCCAASCEDVKLGFSAIYNEDGDGIIIKFTSGAGTNIPSGFTDKGSTGTITDKNGNVETFTLSIANNYQVEVSVSGLDLSEDLDINITAILGTEALICEKCLYKAVKAIDKCCVLTNTGSSNAIIIYKQTI